MTSFDLTALAEALGTIDYPATTVGDDELEIQLAGDGATADRPTAVRWVRISDGPHLLTFSTSYPFSAPEGSLGDVVQAAHETTQYLVLGHFEVDEDGSVHLRYSTVVDPDAPPSIEVLINLVGLLDHQQQHFGDYLEAICTGKVDLDLYADLVAEGEASGID